MAGALLAAAVLIGLRWLGANIMTVRVGATATAGFRFNTDGTISKNDDGVYTFFGYWHTTKSGIGSSYQVRALSAGKVGTWSNSGGADDAWTTINVSREWNVVQATPGTKLASATFEFRPVGGSSATRSATGQASAEYSV